MSGHSKWSTIKHKKGAQDARRGRIFTKLIREIMVAARLGGGDPEANPRLRAAIAAAKAQNMPKDNIERAIKKGTGELEGTAYEEVTYEGYGPGGVAVLVEAMTDNRQRTVADLRYLFGKRGGNLGEPGSVAWMFEKKGLIVVSKDAVDEDALMEAAIEAGAEDIQDQGGEWEIHTTPETFGEVKEALDRAGIPCLSAEISMVPKTTVEVAEEKKALQVLQLMEALEDHDDVQHVYANFDIPEEILEKAQ
ncbi:YebC/PmpR family DNA-binding transcriptional regulator [Dissulfurirhabdus thermomarina]|uniref:Probable transcriptional regulatory protein G3N55_02385 n=1 Tax=Dissulfurirhabdus thermomarina TaxID=1765737 RepID=A0A6N9TKA9_DISTH|nr:YebC/PmpR family DNA-binding transcriptional regulator [Dissulfurirhabdus thermomarina]NDY41702.1 YebC/PmpR family DNA-binding transcriptional regulator [Dissulfurirhabdus thermomarina]NMX23187.1 YebC/PmpR family DNA-binding transcriptional regulator [Dissulfurirhabdus thermomarina]